MATKTFLLKASSVGSDAGPFDVKDSLGNVIATGITRDQLLAGIDIQVDETATSITLSQASTCISDTVIPMQFLVPLSVTTSSCIDETSFSGANNGSTSVVATGGVAPYEYSIDGGATWQTSSTFSNLAPATYTITVRDSDGQTATTTCIVDPAASFSGTGTISSSFTGGEAPMSDKPSSTKVTLNAKIDTYLNSACPLPATGTLEVKFKYTSLGGNVSDWYTLDTISNVQYTATGINTVVTSDFRNYLVSKSNNLGTNFVDLNGSGSDDVKSLAGATVSVQYVWTNTCGEVITSNEDTFVMPMERVSFAPYGGKTFPAGSITTTDWARTFSEILPTNPDLYAFNDASGQSNLLKPYGWRFDNILFNGTPIAQTISDVIDQNGRGVLNNLKSIWNQFKLIVSGTELANRNAAFKIYRSQVLGYPHIQNNALLMLNYDWKPTDTFCYQRQYLDAYSNLTIPTTLTYPIPSSIYQTGFNTTALGGCWGILNPDEKLLIDDTIYGAFKILEKIDIPSTW